MKPTLDMYGFVQNAYDHFNRELFQGQLPQPLLTFQREKNVFGYFSKQRWQRNDGQYTHEISLNPMYFLTHNPLELMQTLVHEMCHLWQHEFGKPGRLSYHNQEWAEKMESLGLMPSHNGMPGGKKTGSKMADYPIPGGLFHKSCVALSAAGYHLPFIDTHYLEPSRQCAQIRHTPEELAQQLSQADGESCEGEGTSFIEGVDWDAALATLIKPFAAQFDLARDEVHAAEQQQIAAKKTKVCYQCPDCGIKLWGKPNLHVLCGECSTALRELSYSGRKVLNGISRHVDDIVDGVF